MSDVARSQRIQPFLWFDTNAEVAANFYIGVFKNSRILSVVRNPGGAPGPKDSVLTISFELDGQRFIALNGGPAHKFNEAVSLVVQCADQDEIDYYWARLTAGGSEIACGWLRDKFGLCWQVVPERIGELVQHPKAMQAMMTMKKLDIETLQKAAQD